MAEGVGVWVGVADDDGVTDGVAEAVADCRSALGWLRQAGAKRFFWKYCSTFDSTPEGNIGPVAEALMSDLGTDQTIYCPAFPENGRAIFMGNLFVGEQPLAESPMKDHPLTPMHDSNLMRLLGPQVTKGVGLANRLSAPFVKTLCTGFPNTAQGRFKGRFVYTGAPIREELLRGDAAAGRAAIGCPVSARVLLVTGGSLGADALNGAILEAQPQLEEDGWFVVHVCGAGKQRGAPTAGYRAYEYVSDGWADMLAAADLVVSRAGANTVFELLALKKPNLLVPLPAAGSRDDAPGRAKPHGGSR